MIESYQAGGCGYSATVLETLTDLGVSYVVHNPRTAAGETHDAQTHAQLLSLGEEDHIPFLVDHQRNVTTYGSDEIVEHPEEHYG